MNRSEQLQNKSQINITEKNRKSEESEEFEENLKTQKKTEDTQKKSEEVMIGNNEDEAAKMEIYSNPKAESGPRDWRSVF